MTDWAVRAPATSANLGAGYDVLGMALTLYAHLGVGDPPSGASWVDEHHPAMIAYRRAGGGRALWLRSPIPAGRGLGFSGAVRVGGAAVAIVEQRGPEAITDEGVRREICDLAVELEGHADNSAPSVYGGLVVVADQLITSVPLGFDPIIAAWVPFENSTSTNESRAHLAQLVERDDVVFNLGRVATFVAACVAGDVEALAVATQDRLHQPARLAEQPDTAAALASALKAGAWAAWLSGSGPTMAAMCDAATFEGLGDILPPSGHLKHLTIDRCGVQLVSTEDL